MSPNDSIWQGRSAAVVVAIAVSAWSRTKDELRLGRKIGVDSGLESDLGPELGSSI